MRGTPAPLTLLLALVSCGPFGGLESVEGRLAVTPARLEFGAVPAGLRITRHLTLQNLGDGAIEWQADAHGAPAALRISPAEDRLGPGARAVLEVSLLADAPGALAVPIHVHTDSEATPEVLVPVLAEITPRVLQAAPASVDFGPVRTGHTRARTVVVTNHAPDPVALRLDRMGVPDDLDFSPAAALSIDAYGEAELTVQLTATTPGAIDTQLILRGDCEPTCALSVPIHAERVESSLVCEPGTVDFEGVNPGTCRTRPLTCTNRSAASILVESAHLDPEGGPFTFTGADRLPARLAPAEALDLTARFCPQDLTADAAQITFDVLEADAGPRRTRVTLEGRGGGPDLAVAPQSLYFGGATVGGTRERTLTLSNHGVDRLHLEPPRIVPPDAGFTVVEGPPPHLDSQAQAPLTLWFSPARVGGASATLVLPSDDPDTPELAVRLDAEGVAEGQCAATIQPEAVSFGLVDVGAVAELGVELAAGPDAACRWYAPRVTGEPAFSLANPVARAGLIPPGQSQTFTVRYAPVRSTSASGEVGAFRIDVPHDAQDSLHIPLLGVAADNDLVVWPAAVDFGPRPVERTHTRPVFVFNLGTDTHRLTQASLRAELGSGLTLGAAPRPIVVRPGDSTRLQVDWHPQAPGGLRGTLRIESDRLPAALRVPLRGDARDEGCGHVQGTICAPHGRWSPSGVSVAVVSDGQRVETTTDEEGHFFAYCLPAGNARVEARRGHFTYADNVTVVPGRTTPLPGPACLTPPPASQIAVVTGHFDSVQDILTGAGISHTIVNGTGAAPALLSDRDRLLGYDIVMLNCGFEDGPVRDLEVAANLRAFVDQGGSLYVSDLAYDAVEALDPGALEFAGDDLVPDAAIQGQVYSLRADVLDPEIIRILGRPRLELALDGDYAVVEAAAQGATVHLVGATGGPGAGRKPLAVTFSPPGSLGRVVFTTVHESSRVADPEVRALLEHLVFNL